MPGSNGFVGAATYQKDAFDYGLVDFDPAQYDVNNYMAFPLDQGYRTVDRSRISHMTFMWQGRMADGSTLAPGNYT